MASVSQAVVARPPKRITGRNGLIDKYFYFAMSLLVPVIVVYGFSHTADANLFHAAVPRPLILRIHAAAFSGWVLFFILQSALVRSHNVRIHRTLGWFGAGLGTFMVFLGVSTAIIMTRFHIHQLHETGVAVFQSIQFNDMLSFGTFFVLAVYWRKKPELHRRFIFYAASGGVTLLGDARARRPEQEQSVEPGI